MSEEIFALYISAFGIQQFMYYIFFSKQILIFSSSLIDLSNRKSESVYRAWECQIYQHKTIIWFIIEWMWVYILIFYVFQMLFILQSAGLGWNKPLPKSKYLTLFYWKTDHYFFVQKVTEKKSCPFYFKSTHNHFESNSCNMCNLFELFMVQYSIAVCGV